MTAANIRTATRKLIDKCEALGWLMGHTLARLMERMFHPPDGNNQRGQWGLKRG